MATHQSEDNMIGLSKVTRPLSFKDDEMKLMRSFSFNKGDPDSLPTPKRSPKKVVLEYSPSFKNWEPQKKLEQSFSFNNSQGLDASQTAKVDNKLEISPRPKSEPKKCDATARAEGYSPSFRNWEPEKKLETSLSFRTQGLDSSQVGCSPTANVDNEVGIIPEVPLYQLLSPKPKNELDQCATKLQKVYRSYRTRRNLADAAVIAEQIWWQQAREKASQNPESVSEKWWHALDYASLNINSFSFYHKGESEKAVSRWSRAKKRLAKVGKGLSKDQKAQKLALQHWLEAIDPRHRYGHNLHLYYDVWFISESTQPFFYWLDAGDGKVIEHAKCPRSRLQSQIITYLGPTERESYEVVVVNGRLIHKKKQNPVNTTEGSKWIFVLSTSRTLYVGQKKKGTFQHSSFLAGAATTSAGRMVAKDGYLQAIWPYSGHYLPTEENFKEFISFLVDNSVDLSGVKRCSVDDDEYSLQKPDSTEISNDIEVNTSSTSGTDIVEAVKVLTPKRISGSSSNAPDTAEAGRVTPRWCTAAGARINCVSSYPVDLQQKALQHVNLSPRILPSSISQNKLPIPSPGSNPRPSPHLTRLGFQPSPRGFAADLQVRDVANGSPKIILSPLRNRTSATSPRRSPMGKVLSTPSPAGFPCPKVTLRLPSLKARRFR